MSTIDTSAVQIGSPAQGAAIPIKIPAGSIVAEVNGAWNAKGDPVLYSFQATTSGFMAVIVLADTMAGTQTTTPSGQSVGGGNGLGFNQFITETGEYLISVNRSHMGTEGNGSYRLVVVFGSLESA